MFPFCLATETFLLTFSFIFIPFLTV